MTKVPYIVQDELTEFKRMCKNDAYLITCLFFAVQGESQGIAFASGTVSWCKHDNNLYNAVRFILHGEEGE
ncbi:hypothetical protein [Listeria newyorkensis]|uniref:hypothetical protein n=1 Tax=Listeria newyorkensis TaxID=1497681 RepID=UPI00051D34CC|nr:hypothetical protein [Listeria newyorkensis]KGL44104.1 hypothetical protein EP58_06550 [Listeria newyorkensis]SQC57481.1 Uncharacterised protein [Listeria newyorkensis]